MNETIEQAAMRVAKEVDAVFCAREIEAGDNPSPTYAWDDEWLKEFARRFLAEWIKQQKPVAMIKQNMAGTPSPFIYKLNAMESAAAHINPAELDYKGKRAAVLEYVSELERERNALHLEINRRKGDPITRLHNICEAVQDVDDAYTKEEFERLDEEVLTLRKERNALQAKLAQAEQDAKRYRWMRDKVTWPVLQEWAKGNLDVAIDAALHKEDKP